MSASRAQRIRALAVETATRCAWAQWASLGAAVVSDAPSEARSVVDPEALLLVSLALARSERRLEDVVAAWAHEGAVLVSAQRLQSLSERFPDEVGERIGDWSRYARQGGDRRWRRLVREPSPVWPTPRDKPFGRSDLLTGPGLMLRMRAGFGVGSKADALTFLLASGGREHSVREVAEATAYTDRAVRTALEEMTRAGFVVESGGHPTRYRVEPDRWASLLDYAPESPGWRFWAGIYGFSSQVAAWSREAEGGDWSDYVVGSRARTLVEKHERELRMAGFDAEVAGSDPDDIVHLMERFQEWAWERL